MLGIYPKVESDSLFPSEKIFLKKKKIKLNFKILKNKKTKK
jgi:hypothetical protein